MGGTRGLATSASHENHQLRGIASGVREEGYGFRNLLVLEVAPMWRALFWTASGVSVFGAFLTPVLPKSEAFLKIRYPTPVFLSRRLSLRILTRCSLPLAHSHSSFVFLLSLVQNKITSSIRRWPAGPPRAMAPFARLKEARVFIREVHAMLKRHWMLCIYALLLLMGFNFHACGSHGLYPIYVQENKGLSAYAPLVATIIGTYTSQNEWVESGGAEYDEKRPIDYKPDERWLSWDRSLQTH
ncbi:hypothetical protein B0H12DRAFT_1228953 [Mycena haematopus]|nr:hypothetical protein B0H12DRAFT_1228953 [Mycena haematopus]